MDLFALLVTDRRQPPVLRYPRQRPPHQGPKAEAKTGGTTSNTCSTNVTYTPNADFNGTDSFEFRVNDGTADSNEATVSLTVGAVNDALSFDLPASPNQTVDEDAGAQTVSDFATNILAGPSDESDQSVSFAVTNGNNSLFSAQPAISPDGTLTYTPAADANGTVTATVTASDDAGTANGGDDTSDEQTFTITLNAANDGPDAVDDVAMADEDGPDVTVNVLGNDEDIDGDTLTISDFTQPPTGEGSVACSDTGCTFTPDVDFNGTTNFEYAVSDGNGGTDTAKVTITVNPTNDAPTISDITDKSIDEDADTGEISFTVGDVDNAAGDLTLRRNSSNQTLVPDANIVFKTDPADPAKRTVRVTPVSHQVGTATITVEVSDGRTARLPSHST